MKILMTGATGFVGKNLALCLVEHGHELVVLSRNPDRARKTLGLPCEIFEWKDLSAPLPPGALRGIEGVVNLAGESIAASRWTREEKRKIRDSRVLGTRTLVAGVKYLPLKAFVSASAVGVYGSRGDTRIDETSPGGEGFLADVCKEWEAELSGLGRSVRQVVLRLGVVLGEGGGALAQMLPVFRSGLAGRIGSGKQWMSWIHLSDLVRLFEWSLESETAKGVINACAPLPITNAQFTEELSQVLKVPALIPAPALAIKLLLGERSEVVTASQRVSSMKLPAPGFCFQFPDVHSALKDLLGNGKGFLELLERSQFVPRSPEEIFPFFAEARNLETLTPPFLQFRVLGVSTDSVQEGTLIDYRLKLHGLPILWKTRIEEWIPNQHFVDTQLKGPYLYWHHTHLFTPVKGGTIMRDRVRFKLPLGALGRAIAGRFVRKDVESIFHYRWEKVEELFCRNEPK